MTTSASRVRQAASSVGTRAVPRPTIFLDTALMTGRAFTLMYRSPTTLLAAIGLPIVLMLFLSVGFADVVMPGAGLAAYIDYGAPLFIIMGITFATSGTAIAAHTDRFSGFQNRMQTLPVAPLAPAAGRATADLMRNLVTTVVVTAVAYLLGFRFHPDAGALHVLGFLLVPLVYGFGLAWLMLAVASWMKSAEAVDSVLNAALLVFSFLSTGFVRLDDLPGWARPIAEANPISKAVEAMRGCALGTVDSGALIAVAAWSLGMTFVFGSVMLVASRRR